MGLFGKKKDAKEDVDVAEQSVVEDAPKKAVSKKEPKKQPKQTVEETPKIAVSRDLASVITRPRITEKAMMGTDRNVYTFEVRKNATKHDVRDAVKELYKVTPTKVNIVNKKPRHYTSRMRGRDMMEKGLRKAYVYLKEGDRIDLV